MKQLVIDIETSGAEFDTLDRETQEYLLKRADTPDKIDKVKDSINLWPLTGEIVAIGVYDVTAATGAVYFQAPGRTIETWTEKGMQYQAGDERACLERFWADVTHATRIITFNGRMFDMPWLMTRSLVHGVVATRNLMPSRYSTTFHVDLADQLAFYGATRHYALDFWCKQMGIQSPKTDISGADVPQIYKAGEYERIARYNGADLRATAELFQKWEQTIGGV
ncbi:MAG: ribonuclease H-like domain-containing protein [bacterium]|nr:ribonuclease H-like domain-containing protein [bacterium]